ncbi:beta-N-acetylhexosaminidase [Hydrogenophaga sp. BPS33]|uniref:beta-N-acetylhexosaminidase n=1 Tax=Hydrogenophaga sp. BPS33 TaxID=2651974 RepID=UPI0013203F17|nr:beta-N-acetylhexosaminidase [Hydrogenophaga sp. BPS33]QHE85120.1 beta-N-acetylhexosaminidase [Hydrogenophaga sp. BPS33]
MHAHAPLIIDVAGYSLTTADRQRLAHPLVGGVILFGRNWQSREQLTALCRQIKAVRHDLLIAVDHEGGRVQRFRTDGFTHLPPMASLGALWMRAAKAGDVEGAAALEASNAAVATGYVLGAELRACGVDLSFTPVLDLDYGESSVIGDRSFARDPRVVTLLAQSLMHGLLQSGMGNCGKHFPGHGFVKADSHLAMPVDRRSLKAILAEDAAPYGWLSASLQAVMPAHVIYAKVDPRPAGFSSRWLQDILRARLGFTGAIFSDDLSMAAARQIGGREVSFPEAALAALAAGGDLVLLCNQSVVEGGAPIDEAIDALSQAALTGAWQPNAASEERRLALLPRLASPDWDALMVSERYMQALSLLPG